MTRVLLNAISAGSYPFISLSCRDKMINIKRAVENITGKTSVYTPIVEMIVNSIQAVEEVNKASANGLVEVSINRSRQAEIVDGSSRDIVGFDISDNGIGFNDKHRDSFDTLYSDEKIEEGGKGFGRFTCLKYFEDMNVKSIFSENGSFYERKFRMGKDTDIIVGELKSDAETDSTGTTIELQRLKQPFREKGLSTIARTLVEKLLPYFVSEDRKCPTIILKEGDGSDSVVLNDYLDDRQNALIKEVRKAQGTFSRKAVNESYSFAARVFKVYSPKNQKSKVSLVAHRREVTTTSLKKYISEFSDEFFDRSATTDSTERNFIIRVYVFSDYLDEHVSLERAGFEFQKESDILFGIAQNDIESEASVFAQQAVGDDVTERQQKKIQKIQDYVQNSAPWYREALVDLDTSDFPYNPTESQIESRLHEKKYKDEVRIKSDVKKLLESNRPEDLKQKAADVVNRISGSSKNELAHYIALRKSVLDIFEKSLQSNSNGTYAAEDVVHDIIFPRKGDSDSTSYEEHNLWIIDERLNFTSYLSSDLPMDGQGSDRPDILAFDSRISFRGDNEASNPVTIFEFKKPARDDFVNPSSKEDPVQQIIRYVKQIKSGKITTPKGREVQISDNTPFYGYVICDLTPKVREWAKEDQDFKPMPDNMGYFRWHENLNLYLEILGWDKLLKDSNMRNKMFFYKLGID